MNDILIFLHLPRTGGTTLRDILSNQYPENETFENKTLLDTDRNFNDNNINEMSQYKLIKGHVYFGIHNYISKPCKYFAMMRDPVERTISAYNYIKKRNNHPFHVLANELELKDFVESGKNIMVNNGQTRLIAGRETSLNVPFDDIDESHLELAKINIDDHFILIGFTERYDETVLLMKHLMNWDTPYYSIANAVKRERKTDEMDPSTIDIIKHYNQLDIDLYDFAKKKFDDTWKNFPAVQEELDRFKLQNKISGKFRIGERLKRKFKKWIT